MDLRPPLSLAMDAFSVPAVVTLKSENPVTTRGVWLSPEAVGFDVGDEYQGRAPKRIMAIGKSDVPTIPRGTKIVAPEESGEATKTWEVQESARVQNDQHNIVLIEADS